MPFERGAAFPPNGHLTAEFVHSLAQLVPLGLLGLDGRLHLVQLLAHRVPLPLQGHQFVPRFLPRLFGEGGRLAPLAQQLFGLFPLVAIPDAQQVAQVVYHLLVALGTAGLPLERGKARPNLAQNVVDAQQIGLGFLQFAQGAGSFALVMACPGRLLEQGAAFVCFQRQRLVD